MLEDERLPRLGDDGVEVVELGRAALDGLVEVDHEGEEAPLPRRALEGAVVVPAEVLPGIVAVDAEPLVEADSSPALAPRRDVRAHALPELGGTLDGVEHD